MLPADSSAGRPQQPPFGPNARLWTPNTQQQCYYLEQTVLCLPHAYPTKALLTCSTQALILCAVEGAHEQAIRSC